MNSPNNFTEVFIPTREAGLKRLKEFAPLAGEIYSNKRNFDFSSIKKIQFQHYLHGLNTG